jgi:hypothetical protein
LFLTKSAAMEKSDVNRRLYHLWVLLCSRYLQQDCAKSLRIYGFKPKLTDSEDITMEIVGEVMGKNQDKKPLALFSQSLA